jgi:hypothetical protein
MSISGSAYPGSLGIVAIVLGVFSTAMYGNELMKQAIITQPVAGGEAIAPADCPADELEEEGLSLAECRQLAYAVHDISISSPGWFKSFHMAVSAAGTVLSLVSVVVGIALVDGRRWAATAAVSVFGALAVLDAVSFTGVVNTGPLLRQMYLWSILLWFFIHLIMALGAAVQRQAQPRLPAGHG